MSGSSIKLARLSKPFSAIYVRVVASSVTSGRSWLRVPVWPSATLRPLRTATLPQFPGWPPAATSNLRLFGDLKGIVDFDTQVPHC